MSFKNENMIKQDYEEKWVKVPKGEPYLDEALAQEIALQLMKGKCKIGNYGQEADEGYRAQTVTIHLDNFISIEIKKELYNEWR